MRLISILFVYLITVIPSTAAERAYLHGSYVQSEDGTFGADLLVRELHRQAFLKICRERYLLLTHDEAVEGSMDAQLPDTTRHFDLWFTTKPNGVWEVRLQALDAKQWRDIHVSEFVWKNDSSLNYVKLAERVNQLANEAWSNALSEFYPAARGQSTRLKESFDQIEIKPPFDYLNIFRQLRELHSAEISGRAFSHSRIALLYAHLYQETQHQGQGGTTSFLACALLYADESLGTEKQTEASFRIAALTGLHDLALRNLSTERTKEAYGAFLTFHWDRLKKPDPIGNYLGALIGRRDSYSNSDVVCPNQAFEAHPWSARISNLLYPRSGDRLSRMYAQLSSIMHDGFAEDPSLVGVFGDLIQELPQAQSRPSTSSRPLIILLLASYLGIDPLEDFVDPTPEPLLPRPLIPQQTIEIRMAELAFRVEGAAGVPSYAALARQIREQRSDLCHIINLDFDNLDDDADKLKLLREELNDIRTHPEYPLLVNRLPEADRESYLRKWIKEDVGFFDFTPKYQVRKTDAYTHLRTDRRATKEIITPDAFRQERRSYPQTYFQLQNVDNYGFDTTARRFDINPNDPSLIQGILTQRKDWQGYWDRMSQAQQQRADFRALVATNLFYQMNYSAAEAMFEEIANDTDGKLPETLASLELNLSLRRGNLANYLALLKDYRDEYSEGLEVGFTELKIAEVYWEQGEGEPACVMARQGAASWARFALIFSSMIQWMSGDSEGALEYQRRNYMNYGREFDLAKFHAMTGLITDDFLEKNSVNRDKYAKGFEYPYVESLLRNRDWLAVREHYKPRKFGRGPSDIFLMELANVNVSGKPFNLKTIRKGIAGNEKKIKIEPAYHAQMALLRTLETIVSESMDTEAAATQFEELVDQCYLRRSCELAVLAGLYFEVNNEPEKALDFYRKAARPRAYTIEYSSVAFARLLEAGEPPVTRQTSQTPENATSP